MGLFENRVFNDPLQWQIQIGAMSGTRRARSSR